MLLEGIFLPVTTPFYPDGRLYTRKLEHNVDRYSRTPIAGMFIATDAGEGDSISDLELREALTAAIAAAAETRVMVAAVSRESVFTTLALADFAAAAGYDAIAIKSPLFAAEPALLLETLTYFRAVADRSPLPVILLSEQARALPTTVAEELSGHPNVIAAIVQHRVAELLAHTSTITREVIVTPTFAAVTNRMLRPHAAAATQTILSAESLTSAGTAIATAIAPPLPALKTRTRRIGFQVLAASTAAMLPSWQAGATGALPRLAACAPQATCEVWQAWKDGDTPLAEEKQARILTVAAQVEGFAGIAALKHACDLNGYFGGRPRLPLLAPDAALRAQLEAEFASLPN